MIEQTSKHEQTSSKQEKRMVLRDSRNVCLFARSADLIAQAIEQTSKHLPENRMYKPFSCLLNMNKHEQTSINAIRNASCR